jgi:hypothetical protein
MKTRLMKLTRIAAIAIVAFTVVNTVNAQCDSWEKHPQGAEEAKRQHVLYRDKFKEKKYDEAYPIWLELFKTVKIPTPAKTTHFMDGAEMSFYFAKNEKDPAKKKEWVEKAVELYDQNAACNGEDAVNRSFQAYYMYANGYDQLKAYKVFEKSMEIGKETPPAMNLIYMAAIAVAQYRAKNPDFNADYMRNLYDRFKKIVENNQKSKDSASYNKYWVETEKQYSQIPEIFGCDYWVEKYTPLFKSQYDNADTLKFMASKLADKCGKDNVFYKEIWARYRSLNVDKEIARQKEIIAADSSSVFTKIQANRALMELDSANEESYKEKVNTLIPELLNSKKEWADNQTLGTEIYRFAFGLYKAGNFSQARTYCRTASKYRPNWGDPYILVGTMYASSGSRCSPATNGTGFDAQVCVWPAIDEWSKAKAVDPSAAEEANRLIGKYSAFMPSKSDLLQRQIAPGSSFTVGCWIGQTTVARGI